MFFFFFFKTKVTPFERPLFLHLARGMKKKTTTHVQSVRTSVLCDIRNSSVHKVPDLETGGKFVPFSGWMVFSFDSFQSRPVPQLSSCSIYIGGFFSGSKAAGTKADGLRSSNVMFK